MRTILVGTDLAERSNPAILRGAELAAARGARLVVCHVGPRKLGVHPLFPQQHQRDVASTASWEEGIADAVTRRVAELTGLDSFDVIIEEGDVSKALCQQAARLSADLVVVMADRPEGGRDVTRDLASSPCSVLVVGPSAGSAVALVTMESDVAEVPALVASARSVLVRPASKFVVIMWVDCPQNERSALMSRIAEHARELGAPIEAWFADMSEMSLLARVATDPEIGLVALNTPTPDKVVAGASSPLDDALAVATSSLLLIRS